MLASDSDGTGAPTPVPLSETLGASLAMFPAIVTDPFCCPREDGLKTIEIAQRSLECRTAAQLFVWKKSPLTLILPIERVPLPSFVKVIIWLEVAEPTV